MVLIEDRNEDVPSDQQMTAWYTVIERVLTIKSGHTWPTNKAYATAALSADIQDCVDRNFLVATPIDGSRPENRFLLTVTPKGQVVFDMLHTQLVATGQAFPRGDHAIASERVNPFDGMDD